MILNHTKDVRAERLDCLQADIRAAPCGTGRGVHRTDAWNLEAISCADVRSGHWETPGRCLQVVSKALQRKAAGTLQRQLVDPGGSQRTLRQKGQAWNSYSSSVLAGRLNVATPSPTNPAVPSRTSAGNAEVANWSASHAICQHHTEADGDAGD